MLGLLLFMVLASAVCSIQSAASSGYIVSGVIVALLCLGPIVLVANRLWVRFNLPDRYHFLCKLCGYRWHLDPGDPAPAVTVRPDLIAKGEQLLIEEQNRAATAEAEAARQYALNEAYYYNVIRKQDK